VVVPIKDGLPWPPGDPQMTIHLAQRQPFVMCVGTCGTGVGDMIANVLKTLERDRYHCALSQEGQPVVAHIIPYSFGRHAAALETVMPNAFRFLNLFAGQTVINRLNNYLMLPEVVGGQSRINRLENLLCLSPTNHRLFGRGFFVLEPLGDPLVRLRNEADTLDSYDVRFSWLPEHRPPVAEHMRGESE